MQETVLPEPVPQETVPQEPVPQESADSTIPTSKPPKTDTIVEPAQEELADFGRP